MQRYGVDMSMSMIDRHCWTITARVNQDAFNHHSCIGTNIPLMMHVDDYDTCLARLSKMVAIQCFAFDEHGSTH